MHQTSRREELGDLEQRLRSLEREVRRWRLSLRVAACVLVGVACGAPSAAPTAIEFTSEDGARRLRLTAEGLFVEEGTRSARFAAEGALVREGELGLSLAPDRVTIAGTEGQLAVMGLDSIWISSGAGRAALSVVGGNAGMVRASGEYANATLGATDSEASLALEGGTETTITALANGALADVAVTSVGDRVAHLRPE